MAGVGPTVLRSPPEGMTTGDGSGEGNRLRGAHRARFPAGDVASFLRTVRERLPAHPESYDEIRKVNLRFLDPDEARRGELETGKNLCGLKAALAAAKAAPSAFIP